MHHILIIKLHFSVTFAFEVIYAYSICMLGRIYDDVLVHIICSFKLIMAATNQSLIFFGVVDCLDMRSNGENANNAD